MKRHNHQVSYEQTIVPENIIIPKIDTSVTSLLHSQNQDFVPHYTGDLPDYSRKSLMELKNIAKLNSQSILEGKTKLKEFQDFENSIKKEKSIQKEKSDVQLNKE